MSKNSPFLHLAYIFESRFYLHTIQYRSNIVRPQREREREWITFWNRQMGRVGQRREGSSDRKLALTFDRGSWQVFREFAQTVPSVIQLHRCNYSQKAGRQSNLTSQVFRPGLVNSVAAPPSDRPTRGNCHLVATLRISSSLEIEWRRFRPRSALPQD